jgi:hypothetical protein
MQVLRLFNEPAGTAYLQKKGVKDDIVKLLPWVGISGICNLIAGIEAAKYYELDNRDVIVFPMTDSMDLYQSRVKELRDEGGAFDADKASAVYARYLQGADIEHLRELGHWDRKQLHNFKYFTWVEQQGRTSEDLNAMWEPDFWSETFSQVEEWDKLIAEFNLRTGVLASMS